MSTWSEERRRDQAAADDRRRKNEEFEDKRRREQRKLDREEARTERARKRLDRQRRRQARASRREKSLTPGNIYGKGTLLLVTASAMASLPAQVVHFVEISSMLLPVPFALEGAAWVMAAGVAYADSKGLSAWVRWLLRGLTLAAAGYAASINYGYGTTLGGLTDSQQHTAGLGLAAVTLGGPVLFEIRQWVLTLSADPRARKQRAEEKARKRHEKKRRRDHKNIVRTADRLISAAPFGTLGNEEAFRTAWEISTGIRQPGMTPTLYLQAVRARQALAASLAQATPSVPETKELAPEAVAVELFLAEAFGPGDGDGGTPVTTLPDSPQGGPQGPVGVESPEGPTEGSRGRFSLGRKGKRGSGRSAPKTPERPLIPADLEKVRALASALGGAHNLTHSNVKKAVGGGANDYLVRLRKAVQAEGGTAK
ncbi:hypothetical protein [Streptomyces sp. NPDC020983]|uniref:hypothetical protein n=1 Tax=Streptomyces sp. NPDC020983 TaxID=3365106 RepID=UPI0037B55580